ncbi:hypothetical protein MKW94_025855 [Papaver nudicaule]|uniref:Membrane-associated kinase regulator 4 n=1 Tax=Papaver nudicaule TaxID=74823 RepID=A0AA41V2Q4_PAPNU|nr:hypothetical protein [Papaver nudicaule]MCL7028596.1 hypothetical protein [Papaver nudicaule]
MAKDSSPSSSSNTNNHNALDEDDYIDIEVSSSSSTPTPSSSSPFYCSYSNITSPNPREFEFQMFSTKSLDNKANTTTTSPADELFYKGKLLPLHLPPRLQMVEKLLQNSKSYKEDETSLISPLTTTQNTPFTSCNISPTESCQVSRELNPNEYFFEDFSNLSTNEAIKMKSWMKKLKKYSSLGLKFKAYSRAYLKALFTKSGCSDEALSCNAQATTKIIGNETVSKAKECLNKCVKAGKKNNPFGLIQKQRIVVNGDGIEKEKMIEDNSSHRRSFSGAIKRCTLKPANATSSNTTSTSSPGSSNSSSFSSNNGYYEVHLLKRSNSANSEIESSIQSAIAHCKQSHHQQQQQLYKSSTRKTVSEVGLCSLTVSRIAAACGDDQERPQLCRG